jgi:hypothetical protein
MSCEIDLEGFGFRSDIDVQHAMKEKQGQEMVPYRILGACHPPLEHQALEAAPDIGALSPCAAIVRTRRYLPVAALAGSATARALPAAISALRLSAISRCFSASGGKGP